MPLYPLYALLFADAGLSSAEISALFAIWSAVAVLAEVPTGVLADRYSRRGAVAASSVLQGSAFCLWLLAPGFPAFAAGFALWALGGSLASGAFEALLFDGLDAVGSRELYRRVLGRVDAVALVAQVPAAVAATGLFAVGGYRLVGAVSVGMCLIAAFLAWSLPEARPRPAREGNVAHGAARIALRDVINEIRTTATHRGIRGAVLAVALLLAVDGLEEYFPLMAADHGLPTAWVPLAVLAVPLVGALGAWLGGRTTRPTAGWLALVLVLGTALLVVVEQLPHPAAMAGVAMFYGTYQAVRVITEARLQDLIPSTHRASVTSVAGLGSEIATLAVYGSWAVGGTTAVAAGVMVVAVALPRLLGGRSPSRLPRSSRTP